jgi:chemotaxis protein methyltransferase CheR
MGSGAYTLAIIWELELTTRFPNLAIRILATDVHPAMLARARRACFGAGSLRELPDRWRAAAFAQRDGLHCLHDRYKRCVTVVSHDIRTGSVDGPFDLIMCRNLVFTYFEPGLQETVGAQLARSLRPAGALVLGAHEQLPAGLRGFAPWDGRQDIYRRLPIRPET